MQSVSTNAGQLVEGLAPVELHIRLNGLTVEAALISAVYAPACAGGEGFSIGSACAARLELTVEGTAVSFANKALTVTWDVDGAEYPLFSGEVDTARESEGRTAVTAYDALYTGGALAYTPSDSVLSACTCGDALSDIAARMGVEVDSAALTAAQAVALPEGVSNFGDGVSCSQAAGYIAMLMGGNALITRAGALAVKCYTATDFSVDPYSGGAEADANDYTVTGLTFTRRTTDAEGTEQTTDYEAGDGSLGFENPLAAQALVNHAFSVLEGLSLRGGTFSIPGGLLLEPGDLFTVDSAFGSYTVGCMSLTMEYDGGFKTAVLSYGTPPTEGAPGPITQAVNAVAADVASVKTVVAENARIANAAIEHLEARKADIDYLTANYATIESLTALEAQIEDLDVTQLTARVADIEAAYITEAEVETLIADKADVADLTAANASITALTADVANISSLLAGSAGVGDLQAIHLTADNAVIDEAVVMSLIAADATIASLLAGEIYTSQVRIYGDEDKLLSIVDNTIQVSDGTVVRVQIGEDAAGDYNLYLWDASGNLLWNAAGVTEAGLNDGIIKDAAIAADANINQSKIDMASVAQRLNEDGSIVVDASKVTIDNTTLSVAYTTIVERTDDLEEASSALQTELEVIQGQITSKVWQSDITEATGPLGSQISTLQDQYAAVTQTVEEVEITVADLQTTVTDSYEALDSRISSLSVTADGITASVTAVQSQLDSLEIGSRNYIRNSRTMVYDTYSFVSRGNDTAAYVGSAVVGTSTVDGVVITAARLNAIETDNADASTAIAGIKSTMGVN